MNWDFAIPYRVAVKSYMFDWLALELEPPQSV